MKLVRLTSLVASAIVLAATAFAQTTNYASSTASVRVGTLLIRSQTSGGYYYNPVPYAWTGLDRDALSRPASWSLENPLAPSTWSASDVARYPGIAGVGQKVAHNDAPYWEVPLTGLTDTQAARFDALLIPLYGLLQLNSSERETLRKFCDQGGTLWVDVVGDPVVDGLNGPPLGFVVANSTGPVSADVDHPLLRSPNVLNSVDVADLASTSGSTVRKHMLPVTSGLVSGINSVLGFDSAGYRPVVVDSVGSVVSVAPIGAGSIVFSGQGASFNLSASFGAASVPWAFRTAFDRRAQASAKFAVNLLTFAQAYSRESGNSRGTSSQKALIDAPLVKAFEERGSFAPTAGTAPAPGVLAGRVVVRNGSDLVCYEADPRVNAAPSSVAGGSVELWRVAGVGNFASPLVVDVPETTLTGTGGATERRQVWTFLPNGTLNVYALTDGYLLKTLSGLPSNSSTNALAPVVVDRTVFFTGDDDTASPGIFHLAFEGVELATATLIGSGASEWKVVTNDIYSPSASPVAGLVPIRDNSGGVDKVIYVPSLPNASGGRTCGLSSWWVGVKGESPTDVTWNRPTSSLQITTRAFAHGAVKVVADTSRRSLRVAAYDATGAPINLSTYLTTTITQPSNGILGLELTGSALASTYDWDGKGTDPALKVSWRVDYDVDWGGVGPTRRGEVYFPDRPDDLAAVVGSPALGPDGHIALTVSRPSGQSGGTFYNLVEYKPGDFQVRTRWDLYDAVTGGFSVAGMPSAVMYPAAIQDNDDLSVNVLPSLGILNRAITQLRFSSAPTVRGDSIYAMASGLKDIGGVSAPIGVLLCFKADPDPVEFQLTEVPAVGKENTFNILQPDVARSSDPTAPTTFSAINGGTITFDRGNVSGGRTKLVLRNLALGTPGQDGSSGNLANVLSTNVPFTVIQEGTSTPMMIQPEATALWSWSGQTGTTYTPGYGSGRFSPLRYYEVVMGFTPQSPLVAGGANLFYGGSSYLPSIVANPGSAPTSIGMVFAQDANVSLNDEFMQSNPTKGWETQFKTLIAPAGNYTTNIWGNVRPNAAIKWPLLTGLSGFDDLRVRVLQATLEDKNVSALAVGEGSVFVTADTPPVGGASGNGGFYAFEKIDLLVADNQRVGRFDATGNPQWSIDSTLSSGDAQASVSAALTVPLSDPVRAYPAGGSSVWVVDAGSNRIVKVDRAGRELRQISSMKIHPQTNRDLLAGLATGESLNLRAPHDMATYVDTHTAAQSAAAFPGETIVNGTGGMAERWEHTLIADTGNNRVVELIDRYLLNADGTVFAPVRYQVAKGSKDAEDEANPSSTSALGVLYWHTPEQFSGSGYAYNSVDRLRITTGTPRTIYAFAFNNVQPGKATTGLGGTEIDKPSGNGGVVLYDGATSKVIRSFVMPQVNAGTYLGLNAGNYSFNQPSAAALQDIEAPLTGIRSVKARYVLQSGSTILAVMVCTDRGVFELYESAADVWSVRWMLTNGAYKGMRHPNAATPYAPGTMTSNPNRLTPMFAERLASGDVLLVNGYVGTKIGGADFSGEVMVVDGSFWNGTDPDVVPGYGARPNFGFSNLSVKFQLPPVSGARDLVRPVFAARQ